MLTFASRFSRGDTPLHSLKETPICSNQRYMHCLTTTIYGYSGYMSRGPGTEDACGRLKDVGVVRILAKLPTSKRV